MPNILLHALLPSSNELLRSEEKKINERLGSTNNEFIAYKGNYISSLHNLGNTGRKE